MDIWLAAVLLAWLPVAAALGILVGRTVATADRRQWRPRLLSPHTTTRSTPHREQT